MMVVSSIATAESAPSGVMSAGDTRFAWQLVNDTVMGGRSSSRFHVEEGRLTFEGLLNTNGGGFASIRSVPQTWSLSGKSAVRLKVRGDGRSYRLRLLVGGDRVSYQSAFDTVADRSLVVELTLDQFYASLRGRRVDRPTLECSDIAGIGFILADRVDGPFRLDVDWVQFV